MNTFAGRCHCGNLSVRFETGKEPAELPLRSCQVIDRLESDPQKTVRDAAKLSRYAWGRHTAEFLVCRDCGGYLGAVATIGGRRYMTMNVNLFEEARRFTSAPVPVDYDSETVEARGRRREENWTPAEVPWE